MTLALTRFPSLAALILSLVLGACATKPEDVNFDPSKGSALFMVGSDVTSEFVTKRVGLTTPSVSASLSFMRSSMWSLPDGRQYPIPLGGADREFAKAIGSVYHEGKAYTLFQGKPGIYALTSVGRRLVVYKTTFLSRKGFRERGERYLNTWSFKARPGSVAYIGNLKIDVDRDPPLVAHKPGDGNADIAFREFTRINLPLRRVGLLSRRDSPIGFDPRGYGTQTRLRRVRDAEEIEPAKTMTGPPATRGFEPSSRRALVPPTRPAAGGTGGGPTRKELMKQFLAGEISKQEYDRQMRKVR